MAILIDHGGRTFSPGLVAALNASQRTTANPPPPGNQTSQRDQGPSEAEQAAARRAEELRRKIQEMLERLEALRRQEAIERQRALAAKEKADQAARQAELARQKADKSGSAADTAAHRKAEQTANEKYGDSQEASMAWHAAKKETELLRAQIQQKREQLDSDNGKSTAKTDAWVRTAQAERDAAVAPRPSPLLPTANFSQGPFEQPFPRPPLVQVEAPTVSPLEQFLQVSPFPGTQSKPADAPAHPAPAADPVSQTIAGIASGKSLDEMARNRGLSVEQLIAEAAEAGVEITTRAPSSDNGDVLITRLKDGEVDATYYHDQHHDQIKVEANLPDVSSKDGQKTVEMSRDSSGRIHQRVRDPETGKTITVIDDPKAGTQTKVVHNDDGTRTETTTEVGAKPVTRNVKPGEAFDRIAAELGMSRAQLQALNPGVTNPHLINAGAKLVVADGPTTVKHVHKDGTSIETSTSADGKKHVVFTSASGRRITLEGKAPGKPSQAETIRNDIFVKGESVSKVASRLGLTEREVHALLPKGTVNVTEANSDNGDVQTVMLFDAESNTMVIEYHDHHHGGFRREVIDDSRTFKVRQYDPKTEKFVLTEVDGGVGYAQKLADNKQAAVTDIDRRIRRLDDLIRQADKMGDSAAGLRAQRAELTAQKAVAQLDADVEQGKATVTLVGRQQYVVDDLAAQAHELGLILPPGSKAAKEAKTWFRDLVDLGDQIELITVSAGKDVGLLEATRKQHLAQTAKDDADEALQAEYEKWKRTWRWSGLSEERIQELEAQGARPPGPSYRNAQEEDEAAWREFEKTQELHDARGQESTGGKIPHRDAWLARNAADDALSRANIDLKSATIAKNRADIDIRLADIGKLEDEKDAWMKKHPDVYSETFPKQAELDAAQEDVTKLKIGTMLDNEDANYEKYVLSLPQNQRHYTQPREEADKRYEEDNAQEHLDLAHRIETLQNAATLRALVTSQSYIEQWEKNNPEFKARLDALGRTDANSSVRAAEHRMEQREKLLKTGPGKLLKPALEHQNRAETLLRAKTDRDMEKMDADLKRIEQGIEGHGWVRDAFGGWFGDSADDARDFVRDQRSQAQDLSNELTRGDITLLDYSKQQADLASTYDRDLLEIDRELQDDNEAWSTVETTVRAVTVATAGIVATLATGGNVVAGMGAAMAVNQLYDGVGDINAMARGRSIHADGHSSLIGLGTKAVVHGDVTWRDVGLTAKDELIDTLTNTVTIGGVGAGMKTASAMAASRVGANGLTIGQKAVVGAGAGTVAQSVDGAGRIGVEALHVGLDGQWGTGEGNQRIKTTAITSAVSTLMAPVTGAASGAIPLRTAIPGVGLTAQFANDGAGNLAVAELTALATQGRHLNSTEALAASMATVPGTLTNIALHPDLFGRNRPRPAATPASSTPDPAGVTPVSRTAVTGQPGATTVPPAAITGQPPAAPRTAPVAPGFDANGVPVRPETLGRNRNWQDVDFTRLTAYHARASAPGSTARPLMPSANEQVLFRLLRQDPHADSQERFVVSRQGPRDTYLREDGGQPNPQGIRAKRARTFRSFEEARAAAEQMGGAWVHRVMPADTAGAMGKRARARAEEMMGSLHVDGDGHVLPIGVPNQRFGSWQDVAAGRPVTAPVVPPHYLVPPAVTTPGLTGQPAVTHQSGQGTGLAASNAPDLDAIIEGKTTFKGARPDHAGPQRLADIDPAAAPSDKDLAQTAYLVGAASPDGHKVREQGRWDRTKDYVSGRAPSLFGAPDYVARRYVLAEDAEQVLAGEPHAAFKLRTTDVHPGIHRLHVYDSFDEARAAVTQRGGGVVVRLVDSKKNLAEAIRQGEARNEQVDGLVIVQRNGKVLPTSIVNTRPNPLVPKEGEVFVNPHKDLTDTQKTLTVKDRWKVYGGAGLLLAGSAAAAYTTVRFGAGMAMGLSYGGAALGGYATARELFLRHAFHAFMYRGTAAGWKQAAKIRLQKHVTPDHENTFVLIKDLADPAKRDAARLQLDTQLTGNVAFRRGFSAEERARYKEALETLGREPDNNAARAVLLESAYQRAGLPVTGWRGTWNRIPPALRKQYAEAMEILKTQPSNSAAWGEAAALLATAPYVRRGRQYAGGVRGGLLMRNVPHADRKRYAEAVNDLARNPGDKQALHTLQMLHLDTIQRHTTGFRGAWRGIHKADRHTIELEAQTLRVNPDSKTSQTALESVPGKLATANTPVGRTLLGLRIASFAWSNSAGTRLYLDPFFDKDWHISFANADSARKAIGTPGTALFAWANGTGFMASTGAAFAAGAKARRGVDVMVTHDADSAANKALQAQAQTQAQTQQAAREPVIPLDRKGKPVKTYKNTENQPVVWRWIKGLGNVESATYNGLDDHGNPKVLPPRLARMPQWSSWGDATGLTFLLTATVVEGGSYLAQGQYGMAAVTLGKVVGGVLAFRGVQQDYQGELHANAGKGTYVYHSKLTTFFNAPMGSAHWPTMNWRGKPTGEAAQAGAKNSDPVIRRGLPPMIKLWAGVALMVGFDEWLQAIKKAQAENGPTFQSTTSMPSQSTYTSPLESLRPVLERELPPGITTLPPMETRNPALAQIFNVDPRYVRAVPQAAAALQSPLDQNG